MMDNLATKLKNTLYAVASKNPELKTDTDKYQFMLEYVIAMNERMISVDPKWRASFLARIDTLEKRLK